MDLLFVLHVSRNVIRHSDVIKFVYLYLWAVAVPEQSLPLLERTGNHGILEEENVKSFVLHTVAMSISRWSLAIHIHQRSSINLTERNPRSMNLLWTHGKMKNQFPH